MNEGISRNMDKSMGIGAGKVAKSDRGSEGSSERVNVKRNKKAKTILSAEKMVAVVLVRSWCGARPDVVKTLDLLRLRRKNFCVVLKASPVNMGMIKKVKDYVTYGEVSEETMQELADRRGEDFKAPLQDKKGKVKSIVMEYKGRKLKPYFRLNPPRKGFGRKGIKMAFGVGGALGYRGEKMNDLVRRML